MYILGGEFRLPFTSPLWIVHWQSKALQKLLSNQYITVIVSCLRRCYKSYSLKNGEMEKSINWNCLPNEFLHSVCVWEFENYIMALSNCTYE